MKIICIGRNYVNHAKELNNKVPTKPLFFLKPETAIKKGHQMTYPSFTKNLHYELELCLLISKKGYQIAEADAMGYFDKIGLGVDYTARDVQSVCKEKGHSWEISKAFDGSASFSEFYDKSQYDLSNLSFNLDVNGERRQTGKISNLIFPIPHLIHHISQYFTLEPGDVIMTGTPAGVGPIKLGDKLEGYLEGNLILENNF